MYTVLSMVLLIGYISRRGLGPMYRNKKREKEPAILLLTKSEVQIKLSLNFKAKGFLNLIAAWLVS